MHHADGKVRWTVDLGNNPRQPPHFGPGRNVEQVVVRPDGQMALARKFRWNRKIGQYDGSDVYLLGPDGHRLTQLPWRWQDAAGFAADGTVRIIEPDARPQSGSVDPTSHEPPYTLHRLVAETEARSPRPPRAASWLGPPTVRSRGRRNVPAASMMRRLLPSRGLLAIAYKVYPQQWDWHAEAVLELIAVKDGQRVWIGRGEAFEDFGHYGTHLVLAVAADGRRVFLGDPAGRVYRWDDASSPR